MIDLIEELILSGDISVARWDNDSPIPDFTDNAITQLCNRAIVDSTHIFDCAMSNVADEIEGLFITTNSNNTNPIQLANLGATLISYVNTAVMSEILADMYPHEIQTLLRGHYEVEYIAQKESEGSY